MGGSIVDFGGPSQKREAKRRLFVHPRRPMNDKNKLLRGLIAAPFAPFYPDLSLNLNLIESFAKNLKAAGASGVFVCGTTGEFASLTLAERMQTAEVWVKAARKHGLKTVLHVGDNCLAHAVELAAHAERLKTDALSAVSPCYFKPDSSKSLVDFLAAIAQAAPSLPFYGYDIPRMTGLNLSASQLIRQARQSIPTFQGIKFTNPDLAEWQLCRALDDGRLNLLFGCDEMLLAALSLGADGAVGITYNYLTPLYRKMIGAWQKNDLPTARKCQLQSARLVSLLRQFGPLPAGKSLLKRIGFDFGAVRPPLRPLSKNEQNAFDEKVDQLRIFPSPQTENKTTADRVLPNHST